MNKTISLYKAALALPIIVALFAGCTYYLGAHSQRDKGQVISADAYFRDQGELKEQLGKLTNDYESACYNYQDLYTSYDELYKKVGANSGLERKARVDGARGNEVSCYR